MCEMFKIKLWWIICGIVSENYMSQNGVSQQKFVPHTPQYNGVTKSKNQTLVETTSCFLQAKEFSTSLWVGVVYCLNYLMNLILIKVVLNMNHVENGVEEKC